MSRLTKVLFVVYILVCVHFATQTVITRVQTHELQLSDAGVEVVMEWCKQGLKYYQATDNYTCVPKKTISFDWETVSQIVSQAKE